MAGGVGSPLYGDWRNWLVSIVTLVVVTVFNHNGKGIWKLASILIGIMVGYLLALPFGLVNFSAVGKAGLFSFPQLFHFGITFEISSCFALGILFAINAVQAIGDFTATTVGAMVAVRPGRAPRMMPSTEPMAIQRMVERLAICARPCANVLSILSPTR